MIVKYDKLLGTAREGDVTSVSIGGGIVPKGAYSSGTTYSVGDMVSYNGGSYVLFTSATAGTAPSNTSFWQPVAPPGPSGSPGVVQSVVAGANVTVDNTDPANPIVSSTGGGGGGSFATITGSPYDNTNLGTALNSKLSSVSGQSHSILSNLNSDDHTQYALLSGRASGQTIYGDTAASGSIHIASTSNVTKGKVYLGAGTTASYDEAADVFAIGTNTNPNNKLLVSQQSTSLTNTTFGLNLAASINVTGSYTGVGRALSLGQNLFGSGGGTGALAGIAAISSNQQTSGTLGSIIGFTGAVTGTGAATTTQTVGNRSAMTLSGGHTVGTSYSYQAFSPTASGGATIGTAVGMRIESMKATGVTNGYGIQQAGTSDINQFQGTSMFGSALTPAGTVDVVTAAGGTLTVGRNNINVVSGNTIGTIQWWNNDSSLTTQKIYANIEVQASQNIATDAAAADVIYRATGTIAGSAPVEYMRGRATELFMSAGQRIKRTAVADANYTVLMNDYYVGITALSAPRTIALPSAATAGIGKAWLIKDESGQAGTFPITISGTIDGSSSKTINVAYGSLLIFSSGTAFFSKNDLPGFGSITGSVTDNTDLSTAIDVKTNLSTTIMLMGA